MKQQINNLEDFQRVFKQVYNDYPTLLSFEDYSLRAKLLQEELNEYFQACEDKNLVEVADAITDCLYIVLGTAVAHGLGYILPRLFEEVHNSNMSKLNKNGEPLINGENAHNPNKPIGKVLKSSNFFEPDLEGILKREYPTLELKDDSVTKSITLSSGIFEAFVLADSNYKPEKDGKGKLYGGIEVVGTDILWDNLDFFIDGKWKQEEEWEEIVEEIKRNGHEVHFDTKKRLEKLCNELKRLQDAK